VTYAILYPEHRRYNLQPGSECESKFLDVVEQMESRNPAIHRRLFKERGYEVLRYGEEGEFCISDLGPTMRLRFIIGEKEIKILKFECPIQLQSRRLDLTKTHFFQQSEGLFMNTFENSTVIFEAKPSDSFIAVPLRRRHPSHYIKRELEKKGLTLSQFAEETGIPLAVVKRVMGGFDVPDKEFITKAKVVVGEVVAGIVSDVTPSYQKAHPGSGGKQRFEGLEP